MKQSMTYYFPVDETSWEFCPELKPEFPLHAGQVINLPNLVGKVTQYEVKCIRGNLLIEITDEWDLDGDISTPQRRFYGALYKWTKVDPIIRARHRSLLSSLRIIAMSAQRWATAGPLPLAREGMEEAL